jgi:hypothetical protein
MALDRHLRRCSNRDSSGGYNLKLNAVEDVQRGGKLQSAWTEPLLALRIAIDACDRDQRCAAGDLDIGPAETKELRTVYLVKPFTAGGDFEP